MTNEPGHTDHGQDVDETTTIIIVVVVIITGRSSSGGGDASNSTKRTTQILRRRHGLLFFFFSVICSIVLFKVQLSGFSLCSSSLISALLVLSTVRLFMKVSFSPDVIPSD